MDRLPTSFISHLVIILCIFGLLSSPKLCLADSTPLYVAETAIAKDILTGYNNQVLPIVHSGEPVSVQPAFELQTILYVSEKFGYLSVWMLANLTWNDTRLSWNPQNYSNVAKIQLMSNEIWLPEVTPRKGTRKDPDQGVKVNIDSLGSITYVAAWEVDIPCQFDLTDFPFDEHVCTIQMGSWAYNSERVNLRVPINAHDWIPDPVHQDWDAVVFAGSTKGSYFNDVTVDIKLRRKSSYYYRVFMAPAAVVMFVVPFVHFLPPGSHEKMTLSGLLLLSVVFMMSLVVDLFPAFSATAVPKVVLFYTADLVLLFLGMIVATCSTMVAHKGGVTRPVPTLLKKYLIDKLAFLCCVSPEDAPPQLTYLAGWLAKATVIDVTSDSASIVDHAAHMGTRDASDGHEADSSELFKMLRILVAELQYGRYREQLRLEWLQLAIIIDRTIGVVFFVLALIITVAYAH